MVEMENNLYGNRSCPSQMENSTNFSSLSFRSFWGLFLVTGAASMAALVLHLAYFLYKHRDFLLNLGPEHSIWRKLVLLIRIYDQMESPNESNVDEEPAIRADGASVSVDLMVSAVISEMTTPSRLSDSVFEMSESEEERGDSSEEEEASGREISRQNPDPPSFADMLIVRDHITDC